MLTSAPLGRRLLAEALGTGLLVTVIVGSGIAASRLSPDDTGLQLLQNSTATALGLTVLILLVGPVSGAHLNPVVSAADWLVGRRSGTGLPGRDVAPYALAQTAGAIAGAELANLMYDVSLADLATTERSAVGLWVGEIVATAGLVVLVLALRADRPYGTRGTRGRRVHRGGLLVHLLHVVREPGGHRRPGLLRHVRGHRPLVGPRLRARPGRRRGRRAGPRPRPLPRQEPRMTPQVVFACRKNGGRSVISRVLTEHYAGDHVVALSAGTEPGEQIHPEVARALAALGLDTSRESPKALTRDMIASSDLAVTLGCGEECPYVPGVRYVDWPVDDPKGQDDETVRRIVADLDARVRDLLGELVPDLELPPSVVRSA